MITTHFDLMEHVDQRRLVVDQLIKPEQRANYSQFLTPAPIAEYMASLFKPSDQPRVRLLEAGAGIGSLIAAFVQRFSQQASIQALTIDAYEIDDLLMPQLATTLETCQQVAAKAAIQCQTTIFNTDFIQAATQKIQLAAWQANNGYTHAILNPPYKKIQNSSLTRKLLRSVEIETVNLYSAFLALTIHLLAPLGELVAIVPRSFCNGVYFKPFRSMLLKQMAIRQIHSFDSRTEPFKDNAVLQELVVLHAIKHEQQASVIISQTPLNQLSSIKQREIPFAQLVQPLDPQQFIHLPTEIHNDQTIQLMQQLPCTLDDLGLKASTGPVVDFRLAQHLRDQPATDTYPLFYPIHCRSHFVEWPIVASNKPNAIKQDTAVMKWLYPNNGSYVLIRRFSSKEEVRRVKATVYHPEIQATNYLAIENHLNVIHTAKNGLNRHLAQGLALYLNSTFYDTCFRQFSGHTQVNVRDLYALRYPSQLQLINLGQKLDSQPNPDQLTIDKWVKEVALV
ncbi:Eco57I restriction-modification methylase domain-containing protein [Herpetosiphon llansteffanensis]|uniref:Eco57I restriction-modification methylase domain-containing protein n=1 Tax=Herpetosiphon llansteffanensis TaxID=2094568 RepID=UPI000D7BDA84|nr:Eco57I restriction-modification methylase domain-containing protein [Herpetosiphon llansteffanensis]